MIDLIEKYVAAKAKEKLAEATRVELGEQIAKALEHPPEGSRTHEVGSYKVTVKSVVNRSVDLEALDKLGLEAPPIKIKRELDIVGLKWYEKEKPDEYRRILATITSKPGRTQIEVKRDV